jgi:hypothetical protein
LCAPDFRLMFSNRAAEVKPEHHLGNRRAEKFPESAPSAPKSACAGLTAVSIGTGARQWLTGACPTAIGWGIAFMAGRSRRFPAISCMYSDFRTVREGDIHPSLCRHPEGITVFAVVARCVFSVT